MTRKPFLNHNKLFTLTLVIVTTVIFSPTFFNDFQRSWDDQWMLLEHPLISDFSWEDLGYHFTSFYHSQYSPVNTIFYLAVYSLFGLNPGVFHASCLLVHILNVLLAFAILCVVIRKIKPAWKSTRIQGYSFLASLLFAIHPLQVESVAWISASKIVLYAFFSLLGLWFYLKYIQENHWRWYAGVLACYLLAFGSKEQAIVFPLNLIIFDWILGRYKGVRVDFKSASQPAVLDKIPFLILALGMWYFSLQNNLGSITAGPYPPGQRLLFAMSSFMDYVFRFIAPVKLYYLYFFPVGNGEKLPLYFWGYPLLVAICTAFIAYNYKRNNRLVVFGFLLFLVNISLVLHIIPMPRFAITADRYMYVSIIGLGLAVVWLVDYLVTTKNKWRKLSIVLFSVWLLFLSAHSFWRTTDWKDSDSIRQNINELIERRKLQNLHVTDNELENERNENTGAENAR